jgi:hypothetical protein
VSALPPPLRRRLCSAVLVVAVVGLATGCGRHAGPDVVVVAMEPGARTDVAFVAWPQTIGLLCNHADVFRTVQDCRVELDPTFEMVIRRGAEAMLEIDSTASTVCAASPEALRAAIDLTAQTAGDVFQTQQPSASATDVKVVQTMGVGTVLAVIETQCPERFADAGVVAREMIIDYEL